MLLQSRDRLRNVLDLFVAAIAALVETSGPSAAVGPGASDCPAETLGEPAEQLQSPPVQS